MTRKSNKVYGIKTITVNDLRVYTINIIINANSTILSRILNDEFWKLNHQVNISNSITKIHFVYTTLDEIEFNKNKQSLLQLLFAHKLNNLLNNSYYVNNKELIACEILTDNIKINNAEFQESNNCFF